MKTSYKTKEQENRIQKKTFTFDTPDQGLIEIGSTHSEREILSEESDTEGSGDADAQDQVDKVLSGKLDG